MKLKLTSLQSIDLDLNIPEQSNPGYSQVRTPKVSEIKSVKSLLKPSSKPEKVIQLKPNSNSKQRIYRSSLHDQSVQVKQLSQNMIVIEEQRKCKKLQYQYQMLKRIPLQISSNYTKIPVLQRANLNLVEQITLFTNYIKSFDNLAFEKLTFLKQLNLNENMITEIPFEQINEHLVSLEILLLNSNQITTLPYLKHIKHLEMRQNPLSKITFQLVEMNLTVLEIDWLDYLLIKSDQIATVKSLTSKYPSKMSSNTPSSMTPIEILKYEYIKKLNSKEQTSQEYYDFRTLFKIKVQKIHPSDFQETFTQLLSNAIQNQHFFFIQFLSKYFPNLHYNKMNLYNKYLLQDIFHVRHVKLSEQLMKLFKPEKWPYQGSFPYLENLYVAVRYLAVPFVQYLINLNVAEEILSNNKQEIIEFLLTEFKETSDGMNIAEMICSKIFENSSSANKSHIVEISLAKFPLKKSRMIMGFWNFIAHNQKLKPFILFTKRQNYHENSLLHFSMKSHEPQTTVELIFSTKNKLDLFLKNSLGQSMKCTSANDRLCKKITWKLEKKYLKQHDMYKHQSENDIRLLDLKVEKQMQIPYLKLSRIRTKNLKEIIKLLQLDCPLVRGILGNRLQNDYLENQQEIAFILQQILEKYEKINLQLKPKQKSFEIYEFYVIILKLLQTQIYDKRCYLASEIGRILCKKKEENLISNLEEIFEEDNTKDQLSFIDNQLLLEYELLHSIPLLKTERFMVSTSSNKNLNEPQASQRMGIFNITRLGCKRCD